MVRRILLVMRDGEHAARMPAALEAARLARESGGSVRMMYASPVPAPRVDRFDRVVADTDREMTRIAAAGEACLDRLSAEVPDVPVERVVRFGRFAEELRIEAEEFGADLVAIAAPLQPGFAYRARAWYLEHVALGSKMRVVLLPETPAEPNDRRDPLIVPVH